MIWTHGQIEFAMCGICLLPIIAIVALALYDLKSRTTFFLGSVGSLLGLFIPSPVIYAQYHNAEAAYMASVIDPAMHMLFYGVIGASVGFGVAIFLESLARRKKLQFSLRTLLLVTAAIAVVLGTIRWVCWQR